MSLDAAIWSVAALTTASGVVVAVRLGPIHLTPSMKPGVRNVDLPLPR